jgi:hypothetical protein
VKGHQLLHAEPFIPVENTRPQFAIESSYPANDAVPPNPVLAIEASSNNADLDSASEMHTQLQPLQRSRPVSETIQKWAEPAVFAAAFIASVTLGRGIIWLVKKWKSRAREDELTREEDSDQEDSVEVKKGGKKKHHRRHVRDWTIYED